MSYIQINECCFDKLGVYNVYTPPLRVKHMSNSSIVIDTTNPNPSAKLCFEKLRQLDILVEKWCLCTPSYKRTGNYQVLAILNTLNDIQDCESEEMGYENYYASLTQIYDFEYEYEYTWECLNETEISKLHFFDADGNCEFNIPSAKLYYVDNLPVIRESYRGPIWPYDIDYKTFAEIAYSSSNPLFVSIAFEINTNRLIHANTVYRSTSAKFSCDRFDMYPLDMHVMLNSLTPDELICRMQDVRFDATVYWNLDCDKTAWYIYQREKMWELHSELFAMLSAKDVNQ
jgi:hypothetical protein